ncbi:hypothetical protein HOO65_030599 [Ceratocystis lukuohia]|uniref:Uncharacterized protein n=1 Tax=Ceratocystis lukuohia TaxID=2019550 RepID=A0ABR4MLD1_9PEZI
MHISPAVAIQIHIEAEYLPDSTVDKLMKALKVTDTNLAFAAPQIFGEAMRKLSVFPPDNDVAQWISEWCVDIKFCQQKNLSQATNSRQIWSAITANLPKNLAGWGMMYMGRHAQQMALGHLDIEDVASNIKAWHELSRCETDSNLPFTSAVEGGPKKNGRKGKSAGNRCPFCKEKHSPNKCRLWVQANRYKSYKVDKRRLAYVAKSVTVPGHPLAVELAKVAATGGFIVDPEMAKDKYSAAASKDDPSESLEALMEEVNARVRKRLAQKCGKD